MGRTSRRLRRIAGGACVLAGAAVLSLGARSEPPQVSGRQRETSSTITRRDFTRTIRLSGTVEAVEATTVSTPRLAGQNNQSSSSPTSSAPAAWCRRGI
jgi:hypothetical protein